jgi:hypothetical protein
LKLPEFPPVAIAVQVPPPEDELLELLLDEELLELDDEELELLEELLLLELLEELEEELLLDELDDELELLEDEELLEELEPLEPVIVPAEAVSVTRSSFAPSSRRSILRVCEPTARLLNVAAASIPKPLVVTLFCVVQAPESSL